MLGTPAAPTLETARLRLRGWRPEDFEAYAALLADPESARFITRTGKPYDRPQAWAEMAFFVGHWQTLGHGMFVVEERNSGAFIGRVGPLQPPGWPGFEIGWALTAAGRGRGLATEAAKAAVDWSFRSLQIPRIISIIHPDNEASRRVAQRLGERRTQEQFSPFAEPCDVWELAREHWSA
ncbi:MAG TPA: GNAT family N-acetyltransferase [Allosphingosinicella sp.]